LISSVSDAFTLYGTHQYHQRKQKIFYYFGFQHPMR
jgi:hypothetical protein